MTEKLDSKKAVLSILERLTDLVKNAPAILSWSCDLDLGLKSEEGQITDTGIIKVKLQIECRRHKHK